MPSNSDYQLNPPVRIKQKRWATCWAACMSSLLQTKGVSGAPTEAMLAEDYGDKQMGGGVNGTTLGEVAKDFGYIFNTYLGEEDTKGGFNDTIILDRLKDKAWFMAAPRIHTPTGIWYHAQVIWGITFFNDKAVGKNDCFIHTMNPATGKYELYPISYFRNIGKSAMFTCWDNTSRGYRDE
jgi:hypothetical protein